MTIKHEHKAVPEEIIESAFWNANHKILKVDTLPGTAEQVDIVFLTTNKHLYLNQTGG